MYPRSSSRSAPRIAYQSEVQAGANCEAIYRGDHELVQVFESVGDMMDDVLGEERFAVVGDRLALRIRRETLEVPAGAEGIARACNG